jgi:hypothetical protein
MARNAMRSSKWLVFIRPSLAGFDRPLTAFAAVLILTVLAAYWPAKRGGFFCDDADLCAK